MQAAALLLIPFVDHTSIVASSSRFLSGKQNISVTSTSLHLNERHIGFMWRLQATNTNVPSGCANAHYH